MSKMACRCGNIIADTSAPSPTEGWLLRNQDQEDYQEAVGRDIVAFFVAVRNGQRENWIRQFFSSEYPIDIDDEGVVTDIILIHDRQFTLSVAECEHCGRLHVQCGTGVNSYRTYAPDETGYAGVLRSWKAKDVEPGVPEGVG